MLRRIGYGVYICFRLCPTADVGGEDSSYGMAGSPTKVKKVENIVFQAKEAKKLTSSEEDIDSLMVELLTNHTIG